MSEIETTDVVVQDAGLNISKAYFEHCLEKVIQNSPWSFDGSLVLLHNYDGGLQTL